MESKQNTTNKKQNNTKGDGIKNAAQKKAPKHIEKQGIVTDPFGSWTGVPYDDIYDTPVQDVDDL